MASFRRSRVLRLTRDLSLSLELGARLLRGADREASAGGELEEELAEARERIQEQRREIQSKEREISRLKVGGVANTLRPAPG